MVATMLQNNFIILCQLNMKREENLKAVYHGVCVLMPDILKLFIVAEL